MQTALRDLTKAAMLVFRICLRYYSIYTRDVLETGEW